MDKNESLCKVCGDKASGKHYGVPSCDGCRGFFKRSIRRGLAYHCKESGSCVIDVTRRNQCQACRFRKCLAVNMKRDAVQHERAPRAMHNSSAGSNNGNVNGGAMASSGVLCGGRRSTLMFPSAAFSPFPPGGGVGPPFPLDISSAYHFIYSQPATLPFSLFHYGSPAPLQSPLCRTSSTDTSLPLLDLPQLKRSDETLNKVKGNLSEDEVTSSEEAASAGNKPILMESNKSPSTAAAAAAAILNLPLTQYGPEGVYESAAKLLFLTVKWTKSIPSFLELSFHDQSLLLEESWSDLFVLNAAEWLLPIDKEYLLNQSSHGLRREVLSREIQRLKEIISKFISMRVDHIEYSCLKALTLFKPETADLEARTHVELLQDQAHCMLQEHANAPEVHKSRFGKLLLLLPNVHSLCKDLLEEMLFRKTIGDISVARVLSDMLKNHSSSMNNV